MWRKGLTLSRSPGFYIFFENTVRKGEIAYYKQSHLFQQCFLPLLRTFFHQIWNCLLHTLQFGRVQNLLFGKGLKASGNYKSKAAKMMISHIDMVGNILGIEDDTVFFFSHNLSTLYHPTPNLNHYQTTNSRLFQTERVCRLQIEI